MLSVDIPASGDVAGSLGRVVRVWLKDDLPNLGLDVCRVVVLGVGPDEVDRIVDERFSLVSL